MRHGVQQMPRALKKQVRLAGLFIQKAKIEFLRLFRVALLPIAQRHMQLELVSFGLWFIQ